MTKQSRIKQNRAERGKITNWEYEAGLGCIATVYVNHTKNLSTEDTVFVCVLCCVVAGSVQR